MSTFCSFVIYCYIFLMCRLCFEAAVFKEDPTTENFQLSLIHFNDFHARFEETSPTSTKCIPEEHKCIGGFPRLYTAIKQLKEKEPDSILLNAGDDFQGTIWYNFYKWNITQYFMNLLPLDAHTIGNHDFDDGIEGLVPYLDAIKFPTVVSNVNISEEPSLSKLFQKSLIIKRKGVRIGVIGVIIKTTNEMAKTGKVKFTDEIEAVQRMANELTFQGVNIIIVISHCGLDIDKSIAHTVNNIDVIVGGHSHSLLYPEGETPPGREPVVEDYPVVVNHTSGDTVLIVQASAYTKYLGNLKVTFDAAGTVKSWTGKPIYLDGSIPQDKEILQLMKPFKEAVDLIGENDIGFTGVQLDRYLCIQSECNLGNFVTDAFVDFCVGMAPKGSWTLASACIINQGGIRASIDYGNITYSDIMTTLPFNNQIQTFNLKGEHLLDALEYFARGSAPKIQVSGLQIVFNMTNSPGKRVVSARIRCSACLIPHYSEIDPKFVYSLVSSDYVANGGGGSMSISKNKMNAVNQGLDIHVLENYIIKHSPVYAEIEGRIKIIT